MSNYFVSEVHSYDLRAHDQVNQLLLNEGIRRDANLDYTCGIFDELGNALATGSCFGNTLRCLAVSSDHQGEGLMNEIVTHLIGHQFSRGNTHLFLYTKCDSAKFFEDLGFYRIIEIPGHLVFMENNRTGFSDYLETLAKEKVNAHKIAAIVMNANPFSLGHLHLIEKAAAENDILHLFIVSEDSSLIPFSVRKQLVISGTTHLSNICYHETGSYMISSATFPSYFQKDHDDIAKGHALLDLTLFVQIANVLGIQKRYVGHEPNSHVTNLYNETMKRKLPESGICCTEIPRITAGSEIISASTIRFAIKDGDFDRLRSLVPKSTYEYFLSPEAIPVIERIRHAENIIHH
ncbi:[citrate (pro-3S)-lyase] ligase [Lachnospiraceae bacterium PF1-21]|nr:[citrate (pro-3S)-lyase] ligase [Lachnospiraceae bacterium OttesenSCG-928-J05]